MKNIIFFDKNRREVYLIPLIVLGLFLITLIILFYKDFESMKEAEKEEQIEYIRKNNGGIVVNKYYVVNIVKIMVKDTMLSVKDERLFEFSERGDSISVKDGNWEIIKN